MTTETEFEIIYGLERKLEEKQAKLDKKTITISELTDELKKQKDGFKYLIKDQKETIDRISAKMSRMARELKRLSKKQ